jgi:hypothetical protein
MTAGRTIVTAHQANYLPYLGFIEKISVADRFVLVDDTQFVKRGPFGWIHRNRILSQTGPQWLTVPGKTHDRYDQLINQVEIDNSSCWSRKHLRSIELSYKKSPYFGEVFPSLELIYQKEWTHLVDLSETLIVWMLNILDIQVPLTRSSQYHCSGKGSDYVLELAQKSGATHYLSGVHGRDYLTLETFEQARMGLIFQDFKCLPYPQNRAQEFISHLSTLDALFNAGPEGTRELLQKGGGYF